MNPRLRSGSARGWNRAPAAGRAPPPIAERPAGGAPLPLEGVQGWRRGCGSGDIRRAVGALGCDRSGLTAARGGAAGSPPCRRRQGRHFRRWQGKPRAHRRGQEDDRRLRRGEVLGPDRERRGRTHLGGPYTRSPSSRAGSAGGRTVRGGPPAHGHPRADPLALLSDREREVATLLLEGLSYAQIANALFVTRSTAGFHLSNVYAKTSTSSRQELAQLLRPSRRTAS